MGRSQADQMADEERRDAKQRGMSDVDAALVSMKRSPTKKKKDPMSTCSPCDLSEKYPYGLQIRLEDESLEKLGLDKLPSAGKTMTLTAEVEVSGSSMRERLGDKAPSMSLELQITKMSLT